MTTRRADLEGFIEWIEVADLEDAIAAEQDPDGYQRWLEQQRDEDGETET